MPVKSKAQFRFMQAAAHDPKMADKLGIKKKVAEEFLAKTRKGMYEKLKERIGKKNVK